MKLRLSPPAVDHRATIGEAICRYCGVGCRPWAEAAYGTILRVKGVAGAAAMSSNSAQLACQLNVVITHSAGHTIRGLGQINAPLVNNGTILAQGGMRRLFIKSY